MSSNNFNFPGNISESKTMMNSLPAAVNFSSRFYKINIRTRKKDKKANMNVSLFPQEVFN